MGGWWGGVAHWSFTCSTNESWRELQKAPQTTEASQSMAKSTEVSRLKRQFRAHPIATNEGAHNRRQKWYNNKRLLFPWQLHGINDGHNCHRRVKNWLKNWVSSLNRCVGRSSTVSLENIYTKKRNIKEGIEVAALGMSFWLAIQKFSISHFFHATHHFPSMLQYNTFIIFSSLEPTKMMAFDEFALQMRLKVKQEHQRRFCIHFFACSSADVHIFSTRFPFPTHISHVNLTMWR